MRPRRTPVRGAVLSILLVAAACGSDSDVERAGTSTTSTATAVDDVTESSVPESVPADVPTEETVAPNTTAPPPVPDAGGAPSPTVATGVPDTTAPTPTPGEVGSFAPWYLRRDGAQTLVLEVRSQSGAEPRSATVDRIRSVLGSSSGKPVSTTGGDVVGGARQWTADEIRAEADRIGPAQRTQAGVVTLLFLHGGLAGNENTIGVAVRSDVAAIFSDRVDEASGLLADGARIEAAVTTHEIGHLLGLVDLVLSTGRADPEHPGHSSNRASVMYFAVESTLVGDLLGGGPPVDFDDADRADLQAISGGSS